jgi:hypothetical protein
MNRSRCTLWASKLPPLLLERSDHSDWDWQADFRALEAPKIAVLENGEWTLGKWF